MLNPISSATADGGPTFDTFRTIAGPESGEQGTALAVDDFGNLFIAGSHTGLDTDGNGRIDRPADGSDPMWIKADADGVPQWIATGSAAGYHTAGQIAVDRAGGVFAIGSFHADQFALGSRKVLRNTGGRDAYLIHIASNGRLLWSRTASGPQDQRFADVASDSAGNVYVIGSSNGATTLEGQASGPGGDSQSVNFLAAWSAEGRGVDMHLWPRGDGEWRFTHLAVDSLDRLWVAGEVIKGVVDLDGNDSPDIRAGDRQLFVARLTVAGKVETFWTIQHAAIGRGGVSLADLTFSEDGDLVLGGNLAGQVDFTGDGAVDVKAAEPVAYLARFDASGALRWVQTYAAGIIRSVASNGALFALAGDYEDQVDLNQNGEIDAGDRIAASAEAKEEIFALVVDAAGRFIGYVNGTGDGADKAQAVAFASARDFWITGFYRLDLLLDPEGGEESKGRAMCHVEGDIFWAKFRDVYRLRVLETPDAERLELSWSGAKGSHVDLYRDGSRIAELPNTGHHAGVLSADAAYRICDAGMSRCSNDANASMSQ